MSRNSLLEALIHFESSCSHLNFRISRHASSKEFLDIQATIECGFTLNRVRDMIRTYNQMHHTRFRVTHNTAQYLASLAKWSSERPMLEALIHFESSCSHLNFRISRLLRARSSLTFRQL